jgi:hypothetical protein
LQCAKIFDLAFQFLERIDQRAQSGNILNVSLRTLATGPKVRRCHARLDCTQGFLKLLDVKETSAIREHAISDLQHLEWRFPLALGKIISLCEKRKGRTGIYAKRF